MGRLTMQTFKDVSNTVLIQALHVIRKEFPQMEMSFGPTDTNKLLSWARRGYKFEREDIEFLLAAYSLLHKEKKEWTQ